MFKPSPLINTESNDFPQAHTADAIYLFPMGSSVLSSHTVLKRMCGKPGSGGANISKDCFFFFSYSIDT